MKVERKTKGYEPIVITLETEEEAAAIQTLAGLYGLFCEKVAKPFGGCNQNKLKNAYKKMELWARLERFGINDETMNKYFQEEKT